MTSCIKVMLGEAALGFIGLVALEIAGAILFPSITDTDEIKSVVAKFITFGDPLPNGFRYFHGYILAGIAFVHLYLGPTSYGAAQPCQTKRCFNLTSV